MLKMDKASYRISNAFIPIGFQPGGASPYWLVINSVKITFARAPGRLGFHHIFNEDRGMIEIIP